MRKCTCISMIVCAWSPFLQTTLFVLCFSCRVLYRDGVRKGRERVSKGGGGVGSLLGWCKDRLGRTKAAGGFGGSKERVVCVDRYISLALPERLQSQRQRQRLRQKQRVCELQKCLGRMSKQAGLACHRTQKEGKQSRLDDIECRLPDSTNLGHCERVGECGERVRCVCTI